MCIRFPRSADPEPQKGPPPITPRVEKDTSVLPKEKELVKPGDEKVLKIFINKCNDSDEYLNHTGRDYVKC